MEVLGSSLLAICVVHLEATIYQRNLADEIEMHEPLRRRGSVWTASKSLPGSLFTYQSLIPVVMVPELGGVKSCYFRLWLIYGYALNQP